MPLQPPPVWSAPSASPATPSARSARVRSPRRTRAPPPAPVAPASPPAASAAHPSPAPRTPRRPPPSLKPVDLIVPFARRLLPARGLVDSTKGGKHSGPVRDGAPRRPRGRAAGVAADVAAGVAAGAGAGVDRDGDGARGAAAAGSGAGDQTAGHAAGDAPQAAAAGRVCGALRQAGGRGGRRRGRQVPQGQAQEPHGPAARRDRALPAGQQRRRPAQARGHEGCGHPLRGASRHDPAALEAAHGLQHDGGARRERRQSHQGTLGTQAQGARRGDQDSRRCDPGGAQDDGERALHSAGGEQQCRSATY
ncbi:unnamed protein product [Phytophthora fragariaefolia]|uniref:Unnamed protein product n=1 Tax=Phytophthora fragariaefolia TaxID=1490495 RepID=A0A9W7D6Z0_9STRA|nr:unnamed protein product [Phytophthora fragariaefolia]